MDSIGSAPPSQLLILMAFPLVGAVLLVAFLAFSYARRNKKPKMKLGIPPKPSKRQQASSAVDQSAADSVPLTSNASLSSGSSHFSSATDDKSDDLELGLISSNKDGDISMNNTPASNNEDNVDLSARLGTISTTPLAPSLPAAPVELLRLLRDPSSGQLIIEVAGRQYTKLADVTDKPIGEFILKLVAHFLAFTNGVILTEMGMKSVPVPKIGNTPEPVGGTAAVPGSKSAMVTPGLSTQPNNPEPSKPEAQIPQSAPNSEAPRLSTLRLDESIQITRKPQRGGLFGLGGTPQPPPPSLPGLDLAKEINDIVQTRLRYSPLSANNQIEITSDIGGGIRIWVNKQSYTSQDDIPDLEVREFIKAAIKEWEQS